MSFNFTFTASSLLSTKDDLFSFFDIKCKSANNKAQVYRKQKP